MAVRISDLPQLGWPNFSECAELDRLSAKEAAAIAGTLSNPSKMPSRGYSIPTKYCQVGGKLRQIVGSTCAGSEPGKGCYAHERGNYRFANVQLGLENRFKSLTDPRWVPAMARQILDTLAKYPTATSVVMNGRPTIIDGRYFRWHDSGDLQGPWHLANICAVARLTPEVTHWLPTREYRMVRDYLRMGGTIPGNLTVRLSAHMVDGPTPDIAGLPVSTVHTAEAPEGSHSCPAPKQDNQCGDCRACWAPAVHRVSYHVH
jgi:hypothetical protein